MLATTAQWLPRLVEGERASIALPIDDEHLEIHAFGGTAELIYANDIPVDSSLIGLAYRQKRTLMVPDIDAIIGQDVSALQQAGLRSAIVAPMLNGGRCLGTVNLANTKPLFYSETDRLVVQAVADLLAGFLNLIQMAETEKLRAMTDDLTGALTRKAALQRLEAMFSRKSGRPSLIYVDMHGFKLVNDTYGYEAGDHILRFVAERMRRLVGPDDMMGRIGGDEFLVAVHDDGAGLRAEELARSMLAIGEQPVAVRSLEIQPRLCVGVASPCDAVSSATELLANANQAMATAKEAESTLMVADETIRRRTTMLSVVDRDLDAAMADGSIVFHYQPLRDLRSNEVRGAEALIRWHHEEFGAIPAPLLIERIEATGRVADFTQWCLDKVAGDLLTMRAAAPSYARKSIALNLTPRQLALAEYPDLHTDTFALHGLSLDDVTVEVVESSAIEAGDQAENTLLRLAEAGVRISLDDFGTGHNALGYFTRFPIHTIKFDRSLVGVMASHEAAYKILRALASMACDLGILSVAEGIEHQVEASMCQELGINFGQGWHLGRPIPLDDFIAVLVDEEPKRLSDQSSATNVAL